MPSNSKRSSERKRKEIPDSVQNAMKAKRKAKELNDLVQSIAVGLPIAANSISATKEGFCYISHDLQTKGFYGHAGMLVGDRTVSTSFRQNSVEACSAFVLSWCNTMRIEFLRQQ